MPRIADSWIVRGLGRLRRHLVTDPAYRHYGLYAAVMFGAYWGFARWPWGWATVDVLVEYLELVLALDAIWPATIVFAVLLACVGLFRRELAQRALAVGTLILASQDRLAQDRLCAMPFWPEGLDPSPLPLLWYVFAEPSLQVTRMAGEQPQAGAWALAVQLLLTYAVLRRWAWPRVRVVCVRWCERGVAVWRIAAESVSARR